MCQTMKISVDDLTAIVFFVKSNLAFSAKLMNFQLCLLILNYFVTLVAWKETIICETTSKIIKVKSFFIDYNSAFDKKSFEDVT